MKKYIMIYYYDILTINEKGCDVEDSDDEDVNYKKKEKIKNKKYS
jgi:hypothetical protein